MSEVNGIPPNKKAKLEIPVVNDVDNQDFTEDTQADDDNFVMDDKYNNFVTQEELQKLKEFKILDEVKSDDESSDGSSVTSEDIPEEEIEKMLEEDLPEDFKGVPKPKEKPYILRSKIIMEEKGINPFEVLPLDWICARHMSGIPVYMHRPSRVVTLAKPYCLGKSNIQRHDIPISAIPCLAYRRALEEEEKQKEIDKKIQEQIEIANAQVKKTETPLSKGLNKLNEKLAFKPYDISKKTIDSVKIEVNANVCPFKRSMQDSSKDECNRNKETSSNDVNDITAGEAGEVSSEKIEFKIQPITEDSNSINDEAFKSNYDNETQDIKCNTNNNVESNDSLSNAESKAEGDENTDTNAEKIPLNIQPVILPGGVAMPPPRVENVNTSWKTQHLTYEQINEYCKKLFQFKTVEVMQFKRWADRRKYTKARKALQHPTLPEGTKLITIPNNGQENGGKGKRDWVMNMNGRCYLSVFHEYVYRALHKQPVYEFTQLENASNPYQATVFIGDMRYGVGYGSSKRQAKAAAARASIQILIPEMNEEIAAPNSNEPDFSFFDYVSVEDPHINKKKLYIRCSTVTETKKTKVKKLEFQKIQLTMQVGKHSASVICKNKKAAKQRASQAILQSLHPHIRSWGSLLRLYGSRSIKSCKEKKLEEQQITLLQDKARRNEPNYAVLEKLRNEMLKLRARDEAVVPIGTLMLTEDLPTHSGSNLNNVDL
ncbi:microprocessor complex subunit DGCR8 [Zerene cesonia]|uniref:microprocessor complex subunit DGCR8 n=1 Tax=Zerene cesonia TaxID=33412 RepID=UPI0018E57AEF|nr:microprocessor complex subunit DGCR8 [Zerene cesonia]